MEIPQGCPVIHHSLTPLINKRSVFVAHAAQIKNAQEIALVKQVLLSDKKIAKATHNITAFRWEDESGLMRQECDDDGETAAGGRLLHMLQSADCRGVFVMVTRWCVFCAYTRF
jgi:putative IMPACT (imprinted ancient) family translation regulator